MTTNKTDTLLPHEIDNAVYSDFKAILNHRFDKGRVDHLFNGGSKRSAAVADDILAYDTHDTKFSYQGKRSDLEGGKKIYITMGKAYGLANHESREPLMTLDACSAIVGKHVKPGDNDLVKKVEILSFEANTREPLILAAPTVPVAAGRHSSASNAHVTAHITKNTQFPLTMVDHPIRADAATFLLESPTVTPHTFRDMAEPYGRVDASYMVTSAPVADPVATEIIIENEERAAANLPPLEGPTGQPYEFPMETFNDHVTVDVPATRVSGEHYKEFSARAEQRMRKLVPFGDATSPAFGFYLCAPDPEKYDARLTDENRDKPLNIEATARTTFLKLFLDTNME